MDSRRILVALVSLAACAQQASDYAAERERMVREQLESRDIHDRAVLDAMRTIPRHRFMPAAAAFLAYRDGPAPIGHGQTISQPYIVALMSQLLEVEKTHRVLEIGTGSGYQAAVLAKLAQHVYSVEIVPELAESAREVLAREGFRNVTVRTGDGYAGWPEHAPFDRIILTAAPPEIPQALVDQLKPGGRMVAPVGPTGETQDLILIEKDQKGNLKRRSVIPVRFVPMVPGRAA
jgi:protein-L-isoaspartate(D-aspartate) O-methyltransferase